jgi:hypothetical protein
MFPPELLTTKVLAAGNGAAYVNAVQKRPTSTPIANMMTTRLRVARRVEVGYKKEE